MTPYFVLPAMIFAHIIADFNLQGWLANAKQRAWWKKNAPAKEYRFDWIPSLFMHSVSWSFMIMLPLVIYYNFECSMFYVNSLILNTIAHMVFDHLKANVRIINLCDDQFLHMIQIVFTFVGTMIVGHI